MATINFTDYTTVVPASWLNDVDAHVYEQYHGQFLQWALSDQSNALVATENVLTIPMPRAYTINNVWAFVNTVSSSGTPTFDIKQNGTTIFSTKITIDENEKDSRNATVPPVLSITSGSAGDILTFDIDVAGTGAKGAIITMEVDWV